MAAPRAQSPLPANMAALTEDELLARALALSREEHAREQELRRMAARQGEVMSMRELEAQMQAAGFGYEVEYDDDQDHDLPTVASAASVSVRSVASAGQASVRSAHSVHSARSAATPGPAPGLAPAAPAPAAAYSPAATVASAFSVSAHASSLFAVPPVPPSGARAVPVSPAPGLGLGLAPIGPPPSLALPQKPKPPASQQQAAVAPPAKTPSLPGLEACFGGDDDDDDADDDEPPTDLTCPIKFMLLVDPGSFLRACVLLGLCLWVGRRREGWGDRRMDWRVGGWMELHATMSSFF